MRLAKPAIALDPRRFGRRSFAFAMLERPAVQLSDDVKLFLSTFAAGFVVVSVLIA